jgi:hypothetical protein
VSIPPPGVDVADECPPARVEAKRLAGLDDASSWAALAEMLDEVKSPRARLVRAQLRLAGDSSPEVRAHAMEDALAVQALPGVTPTSDAEVLHCEWKWGCVRVLEVTSTAAKDLSPAEQEALTRAAQGLLCHPSLRFLQELQLSGRPGHTRAWVEALHRGAPPALERVVSSAFGPGDRYAIETAFRFPKWTFRWTGVGGEGGALGGRLRRIFGR